MSRKSKVVDELEQEGQEEGVMEGTGSDFSLITADEPVEVEVPTVGFRVENIGAVPILLQSVQHDHTGILHAKDIQRLEPGESWESHGPFDMLRVKQVE